MLATRLSIQSVLIPRLGKLHQAAASVYLAILWYVSATGKVNVTGSRLASLSGCRRHAVYGIVKLLEKDGIITVTRKQGNRGNRYFLNSQE